MGREHGSSWLRPSRRLAALIGLSLCGNSLAQSPVPSSASASEPVPALDNALGIPDLGGLVPAAKDAKAVTSTLQILVVITILTLVPSILIMTTSFTRIIIVLSLLRQALAIQQLPPAQVLLALSLFLTMLIMAPAWAKIHEQALTPYLEGRMGQREALETGAGHLRDFMYRQIEANGNTEDVYLFLEYRWKRPVAPGESVTLEQVPTTALISAFMISELKTALLMGFRIYLPFLVIDMVIAAILISMGMMMLPPVLISLPFKLLLFVLADGWHLIVRTLLYSFV